MTSRSKCHDCKKPAYQADGCARVVCPMRRQYTAQATGDSFYADAVVSEGLAMPNTDGMRRQPHIQDEQ